MDAACGLIHERGYAAIGVAEICARADVRKGSFYHFFESKQALTAEVIEQRWTAQRAEWAAEVERAEPAVRRLKRLLRGQAAAQARDKREHGRVLGCLFGNLASELATTDEHLRARIADVFDEQVAMVAGLVKEMIDDGDIPRGVDEHGAARSVLAHLEGMVLFAKLADDPSILDGLWEQTVLLFRA